MGEDYLTCVRGIFCCRKSYIIHRYLSAKMVRELEQMAYDERWRKLDLFSLKGRKLRGGSNCCIQIPKVSERYLKESTQNKAFQKHEQ